MVRHTDTAPALRSRFTSDSRTYTSPLPPAMPDLFRYTPTPARFRCEGVQVYQWGSSGMNLEYSDPDASDHAIAANDLPRQEPAQDDERDEGYSE
jgi:hypothetical protein